MHTCFKDVQWSLGLFVKAAGLRKPLVTFFFNAAVNTTPHGGGINRPIQSSQSGEGFTSAEVGQSRHGCWADSDRNICLTSEWEAAQHKVKHFSLKWNRGFTIHRDRRHSSKSSTQNIQKITKPKLLQNNKWSDKKQNNFGPKLWIWLKIYKAFIKEPLT